MSTAFKLKAHGGLSLRIGWVVLLGCLATSVVAVLGATSKTWTNNENVVQLFWLAPVAVSALCGIVLMRTARLSTFIENELLRATSDGWRKARPLVSPAPLAAAWNSMLEQAAGRAEVAESLANVSGMGAGALARAVRSLPIGLAVSDSEGRVSMGNMPLAALCRFDDSESLEGKLIADLLQIESSFNVSEIQEKIATAARTICVHIRRGENANDGVLRVTRNRLAGRNGDDDGYVWVVQDFTQQTLAVEARDQFLHTASHELRTPLANLKAYAEALVISDGVDVEQQKEFCNIINDESTRLARLVDELLAVGQMEAGSIVLHRSDVDFSRVLHEAIDHVRPNLEQKKQKLTVSISPKLPTVKGDKDKLQAAVVNLIGNAVKYTSQEGQIEVRAATEGSVLQIQIQDSGYGIADGELEKVFEKFYRSEDERTLQETGNGLGLAFSREVVRRHGGDIVAESVLNEGSVFTLSVPVLSESST